MADYHSPTVVAPFIPESDMTPLERLILGLAFDEEEAEPGLVYFHSSEGPSDVISTEVEELRSAYAASQDTDSAIRDHVAMVLEQYDKADDEVSDDCLDIDLGEIADGWPTILQDLVRRSTVIDEIVVTAAWCCSKMLPDGFGGSVGRITADAIQTSTTSKMLATMRELRARPGGEDSSGHETRHRVETIAATAGWDSFTLMLLIAQWVDRRGETETLIDHLDRLASDEDG